MAIIYYPQGTKIEERNTASGSHVVQTLNVEPNSIFYFDESASLQQTIYSNHLWYSSSIINSFSMSIDQEVKTIQAFLVTSRSFQGWAVGDKIPFEYINDTSIAGWIDIGLDESTAPPGMFGMTFNSNSFYVFKNNDAAGYIWYLPNKGPVVTVGVPWVATNLTDIVANFQYLVEVTT